MWPPGNIQLRYRNSCIHLHSECVVGRCCLKCEASQSEQVAVITERLAAPGRWGRRRAAHDWLLRPDLRWASALETSGRRLTVSVWSWAREQKSRDRRPLGDWRPLLRSFARFWFLGFWAPQPRNVALTLNFWNHTQDLCGTLSFHWKKLKLEKSFSERHHKEGRFTTTQWFAFGCLSVVHVAVLLCDGGAAATAAVAAAAAPQLSPRYALIKRRCCDAKHEVSVWESMSVHVWEPVRGHDPGLEYIPVTSSVINHC